MRELPKGDEKNSRHLPAPGGLSADHSYPSGITSHRARKPGPARDNRKTAPSPMTPGAPARYTRRRTGRTFPGGARPRHPFRHESAAGPARPETAAAPAAGTTRPRPHAVAIPAQNATRDARRQRVSPTNARKARPSAARRQMRTSERSAGPGRSTPSRAGGDARTKCPATPDTGPRRDPPKRDPEPLPGYDR